MKCFRFFCPGREVIIMHDRISALGKMKDVPSVFIWTGDLYWKIDLFEFAGEDEKIDIEEILYSEPIDVEEEVDNFFEKIKTNLINGVHFSEFKCAAISCETPASPKEIEETD